MEIKKKVHFPSKWEERVDSVVCDLCKSNSTTNDTRWPDSHLVVQNDGVAHINETVVRLQQGYHWPECYKYTTAKIDICPTCFWTKLKPWLESQGAEFRIEESRD